MNQIMNWLERQREVGLLIVRLAVGFILFWAGYAKVFLAGMAGVTENFRRIGIWLPEVAGPFISLLELVGGAALIVGLFTRYFGILFTIEFIVALLVVNLPRGFNAGRLDLMLIVAGVLFATHGAGRISLDAMLRRRS